LCQDDAGIGGAAGGTVKATRTRRDPPRTLEAAFQHRDRKLPASRPKQRLQIQLPAKDALAYSLHTVARTSRAPHFDAPTGGEGISERFDGHRSLSVSGCHQNK
jgi:hypothetical protein